MTAMRIFEHRVQAYNVSHASENKIHDDSVAKKLGFTGGLVPGVEVFAYATHPAVACWGKEWLERGHMEARFAKPVYDGHFAIVTATDVAGALDLKVESEGTLCATGRATLPMGSAAPPDLASYAWRAPPAMAARPMASETSLAEGTVLGVAPVVLTKVRLEEYLGGVRETHPIYAAEGLAHHGILLRLCNALLRDNVLLSPWIHVGSAVRNFATAKVGDELAARARVVKNYDKKGHRLVDLDCVISVNDKVIAHVAHSAIYKLRHLAEA